MDYDPARLTHNRIGEENVTRKQRLDRLVEVFLDESLQPGPELLIITGFMPFEWMREIHAGFEKGTKRSFRQSSRRIVDYCEILQKRIISDPLDPQAGFFRNEKGEIDSLNDPNCTNFALMRMLGWYFNHFKNLSPTAQKKLKAAIETYAHAQARRRTHFGYTNIVLMEIANRILTGEVLGDREIAASGFKRMEGWLEFTALASGPSEFNSPTYTGVCLYVIGALLQWTKGRHVRLLASIVQERLWLHTAMYFHRPTAQLAGPHSRSYHPDITFNPSMIKSALYAELNDERLMGPNHTLHDSSWSAHRIRFFMPIHIRALIEDAQLPFQARETVSILAARPDESDSTLSLHGAKEVEARYEDGQLLLPSTHTIPLENLRVRGDTTCYQTKDYSLGTIARWQMSVQRECLFATWRHQSDREWDFFRYLFNRLLINGIRADWFYPGHFYSCQEGGTALVVQCLPDSPRVEALAVSDISIQLVMPHASQFDDVALLSKTGMHKIKSGMSTTLARDQSLALRDGDVYIGLLPFTLTGLDGKEIELVSQGAGYSEPTGFDLRFENQGPGPDAHNLSLRFQVYKGRRRKFLRKQLAPLRCGYVIEMASRDEVGDFDSFCSMLAGSKVIEKAKRRSELYTYRRKGLSLSLEIQPNVPEAAPRRVVNGEEISGARLESPDAVQGSETILKSGDAILKKNNVPVWLIANSKRKHYVVTNPCRSSTPIDLRTPHGRILIEHLHRGRMICDLGDKPSIVIESFEQPGKIEALRMKKPAIEIRV